MTHMLYMCVNVERIRDGTPIQWFMHQKPATYFLEWIKIRRQEFNLSPSMGGETSVITATCQHAHQQIPGIMNTARYQTQVFCILSVYVKFGNTEKIRLEEDDGGKEKEQKERSKEGE